MTIFPELFDQDVLVEQVTVADEITLTLRATSPAASCSDCGPSPRGYKADTAGPSMIFPGVDVLFIWCWRSVAFVVKRPRMQRQKPITSGGGDVPGG